LYARFFTKVLFDLGYVGFDEPFRRLFNQGMVCKYSDKTGKLEKTSKSKGNVVNPDPLVEKYGTDTVRLYELFIGPPEVDSEWSDQGIEGVYRFLNRIFKLVADNAGDAPAKETNEAVRRETNLLAYKVTDRLESFKFNTAISAFMEFINAVGAADGNRRIARETLETAIILLAPFAPHLAEELWEMTGHAGSVFHSTWPTYDKTLLELDTVEIPVQINGKVRATLSVEKGTTEAAVVEQALALPHVQQYTGGKTIAKKIYVPDKILNLVVK
jgi:leucyl-tRNA synthetase